MTYTQTYDQGSLFMNYMNSKTYLESHRDDRVPPFALALRSFKYITEGIRTQEKSRSIILITSESVLFVQLTPGNYSDGSGHMAVALALLVLGGIGAVAGFASQSISDAVTGKGFDWGRSGIAAAAGFLGGLCYAIPGVGGYVGAAVSSGLNAIGQMAYSGESYFFDDYAIVGLTSAGIGVLSSWAFGKLTSGISYFADAGYFLEHFMEFAGDAGGIVLKNSVILQLSGQLLVRNTVSTIVNDVFNSAMLLNRGADYFLRYYRYRQSGMNPWEAFWYGMSY